MHTISCPHCQGTVQVDPKQINCKIFRHGIYKNNGQQIPPHTKKPECDRLASNNLIWGCGKPFWFDGKNVKICDYI